MREKQREKKKKLSPWGYHVLRLAPFDLSAAIGLNCAHADRVTSDRCLGHIRFL